MYIILPATIIYTQELIQCPKRINVEAGLTELGSAAVCLFDIIYLGNITPEVVWSYVRSLGVCITTNVYTYVSAFPLMENKSEKHLS